MYRQLEKCCIHASKSLMEGLCVIEAGGVGLALVIDDHRHLKGTLTDGDVRRALLAGLALNSPLAPHMCEKYTFVLPETGRAEVLDIMQARYLEQVPVVDRHGKLVGLHLLHELIGAASRSNWAVIMAGGKGTRLYPITKDIPKPMIRVAGRPILERILLHLVGLGIRRMYLSVSYLGHVIEEHFGDGSKFGCQIEYLRETEPLGTGGALALLPAKPTEPVVVMNGDLITQANVVDMLSLHAAGGHVATMAVRRYTHQVPFGCVEIDGNRICRVEEKPILDRFINAGIYVLSPEIIGRIPNKFFPITDLFVNCLERGETVGAFEIEEDWIDVGQREHLKKAQEGAP